MAFTIPGYAPRKEEGEEVENKSFTIPGYSPKNLETLNIEAVPKPFKTPDISFGINPESSSVASPRETDVAKAIVNIPKSIYESSEIAVDNLSIEENDPDAFVIPGYETPEQLEYKAISDELDTGGSDEWNFFNPEINPDLEESGVFSGIKKAQHSFLRMGQTLMELMQTNPEYDFLPEAHPLRTKKNEMITELQKEFEQKKLAVEYEINKTEPDDFLGKVGSNIVGIIPQLPVFMAGASVRNAKLVENVLLKLTERGMAKTAAVVSASVTSSGSFGLVGALTEGHDSMESGDYLPIAKEFAFGAIVGTVGTAAKVGILPNALAKSPVLAGMKNFAGELTGFLVADKYLHGVEFTADNGKDVAATLVGLMFANRAIGRTTTFGRDMVNLIKAKQYEGVLTRTGAEKLIETVMKDRKYEVSFNTARDSTLKPTWFNDRGKVIDDLRKRDKLMTPKEKRDQKARDKATAKEEGKNNPEGFATYGTIIDTVMSRMKDNGAGWMDRRSVRIKMQARDFNAASRVWVTLHQLNEGWGHAIPGIRDLVDVITGVGVTGKDGKIKTEGLTTEIDTMLYKHLIEPMPKIAGNLNKEQLERFGKALVEMEGTGKYLNPRAFKKKYGNDVGKAYVGHRKLIIALLKDAKKIFLENAKQSRGGTANPILEKQMREMEAEFDGYMENPFFPRLVTGDWKTTLKGYTQEKGKWVLDSTKDVNIYLEQKVSNSVPFTKTLVGKKELSKAQKLYAKEIAEGSLGMPEFGKRIKTEKQGQAISTGPRMLVEKMKEMFEKYPEGREGAEHAFEEFQTSVLLGGGELASGLRSKAAGSRHVPASGISYNYAQVMSAWVSNLTRGLVRFKYEHSMDQAIERTVKYKAQLSKSFTKTGQTIDNQGLDQMIAYMRKTKEYIFNPKNEHPRLRQYSFLYFFEGVPRQAVVNTTQIVTTFYPNMAKLYGDKAATVQIMKAINDLKNNPASKKYKTLILKEENEFMEAIMRDGIADQSYAQIAASMADGKADLISGKAAMGKPGAVDTLMGWGIAPFKMSEIFSRRVGALAVFRQARSEGASKIEAYNHARQIVQESFFDYSRYNRPRFMRGPVGAPIGLFKFYLQGFLHVIAPVKGGRVDTAALRALGVLATMAGANGLPFADLLANGVNSFSGKQPGQGNSYDEIITELAERWNEDPETFLHGVSGNFFGIPAAFRNFGYDTPDFDISASLGANNMSFGTTEAGDYAQKVAQASAIDTELTTKEKTQGITEIISGFVGPVAMPVQGVIDSALDDNPDKFMRMMKMMPPMIKNFVKGYSYTTADIPYLSAFIDPFVDQKARGKVQTQGGTVIAEIPEEQRLWAAFEQILGFTPTIIKRGWEDAVLDFEAMEYWTQRRLHMISQFKSLWQQSDGGIAKDDLKFFENKMRRFNAENPYKEFNLSAALMRSAILTQERRYAVAQTGVKTYNKFTSGSQESQNKFKEQLLDVREEQKLYIQTKAEREESNLPGNQPGTVIQGEPERLD